MRRLLPALLACLVLVGCGGGGDPEPSAATPTATSEPTFTPPDGVTLSPAGTVLQTGRPGVVALRVGERARSAVTVNVTDVRKGRIKDFEFFTLDAGSEGATPYYVRATVRNEGPSGLGGTSLPLYAHPSGGSLVGATSLVGDFEPCPTTGLPRSLLPGRSASLCLAYLLPKGSRLATVDLVTDDAADAVRWKP